ncbi:hypothetical protein DVH05_012138 [Phytophthora capsici]|nr:hypothetical protein DVH05_012138 [Phytophthora capsici]
MVPDNFESLVCLVEEDFALSTGTNNATTILQDSRGVAAEMAAQSPPPEKGELQLPDDNLTQTPATSRDLFACDLLLFLLASLPTLVKDFTIEKKTGGDAGR